MVMTKTQTELNKDTAYWPISGLPPLPFVIDDLQDGEFYDKEEAWEKLNEGFPYLEKDNFADKDMFWKYWFASIGFLDYASVIIYGPKGKGKSLFQAWAIHKMAIYFGKRLTIDWTPPIDKRDKDNNLVCPEVIRKAYRLFDKDYAIKIRDSMNMLADYQKRNGKMPPKEMLEKLIIYNAAWGFDESQTWADKAHRTNLTKLIAGVDTMARHIHTSMFFTFINPSRCDAMINDLTTHMVSCDKDREYYDTCTYSIFDKRNGISKKIHLRPADWTHIWDTHSIPQVSHNIYINLGGRDKSSKSVSLEDFVSTNLNEKEVINGDN